MENFDKNSFKASAGLNGVGITCVNALSTYMKATSTRDGYDYFMEFSEGKPTSEYKKIKTKNKFKSGTTIECVPDASIFENPEWDEESIINDLKHRTYTNAGLKIIFITGKKKLEFYNENGIQDYIEVLNQNPIIPPLYHQFNEKDNFHEFVINYANTDEEIIKSFVNGLNARIEFPIVHHVV